MHRSSTDKIISGVCGGFAEYFGLDSTLVRLLMVLITLFWGTGLIMYVVAMFIFPEERHEDTDIDIHIE